VEPSEPRALTVDEAIALAILLQKQHHLAEAEQLYAGVLDVAPQHPDALHYSGLLAHQRGRTDEAVNLIGQSLALSPNQADWHSNLGIVLQSSGRLGDAIAEYERAIELDPGHANAHSNLGVLLRAAGRSQEAEAAYRTALRLCPDHVDAYTNLGILLNGLNRPKEASQCFCKAITLRPRHPDARRLLALAHCMIGEVDEAVRVLQDWLEDEPGEPVAQHMLAASTGTGVPSRASNAFVEKTFDAFAGSFEAKLESLAYRAPDLVVAALAGAGISAEGRLEIVDIGCGTGLCGPLLRPYASRLVGVDLSAGMLVHAGEKDVYTDLQRCEATEYLRAQPRAFDAIVSADTLVYFGDLSDFCDAAASALRPCGLLVFTLEHAVGEDDVDYRLEMHGRYSHGLAYVSRVLDQSGLTSDVEFAELRTEAGSPVAGLVVRANKPARGSTAIG
jgi:predicted TPR repeat methyltransferase